MVKLVSEKYGPRLGILMRDLQMWNCNTEFVPRKGNHKSVPRVRVRLAVLTGSGLFNVIVKPTK
jgi:hypothetical protein